MLVRTADKWVKAAVEEIQTKEGMFEHAWSHLKVSDAELPDVLLHAEELNRVGQLFKPQQSGVVPELPPDEVSEAEEEWNMHAEDLQEGDVPIDVPHPDVANEETVPASVPDIAEQETVAAAIPEEVPPAVLSETPAQRALNRLQYLRIAYGRYPPKP